MQRQAKARGSAAAPGSPACKAARPSRDGFETWNDGWDGYLLIDLKPSELRAQFRVIDSLATSDPQVRTAAAFVVAAGRPQLTAA
jgi:hypothetical protein